MTRHEPPQLPQVLVVDDDRDNLSLLSGILGQHGCSVRLAPNGTFALESARAAPPDLILLDIGLPDLDGYAVCELLKGDPRTRAVPVIFLSARQATFDIVRAFAIGAVDYIIKPFATEEVLARVQARLAVQQMQRQLQHHLAQLEHEMSERRQAEAELERARLVAEQAARAKAEFVAQMSHEIRTPMNAVVGLTTLLLTSQLTPAQRDDVEAIRRSGGVLLTLIDDILDFSRIEAGKLTLEQRPFALSACVEEAIELVTPLAEAKRLGLRYLADPALPHAIVGDQGRLRQILINLLSNAVRFTERGEIVVRLAGAPGTSAVGPPLWDLTISVCDTGIGIAPAQLNRIFQLFEQASSAITRQYGGSGLGLTISRSLAELMGGQIRAESTLGAGSTFTVELAAPAATVAPAGEQASAHRALAGRAALLLADCAETGEMLARQLSAWRMAPTLFVAAADALAWLRAAHPVDVVLLARDGADAAALPDALRAAAAQPALPVVLWAGMAQRGQLLDQIDHASTALLPLPIRPGMLHGALLRLLSGEDGARLAPQANQFDATLGERHPLRILVAEDNAINQQVAVRLLAKLGYEADVASNGLDVLEALKREPYDLVLMDVQMPEMTGVEAATHIRMLWPPQRWPRIAAVTAYASEENRTQLLGLGMDDYIRKPMRLEELLRVLQATRPRQPPAARPAADTRRAPALDEQLFAAFVAGVGEQDPAADAAFIAAYVAGMGAELRRLREAHSAADGARSGRAAHTLKGLSLQIGALELAGLCARLEAAGEGSADVAGLLGAAEGAYAALQRALAKRGLGSNLVERA